MNCQWGTSKREVFKRKAEKSSFPESALRRAWLVLLTREIVNQVYVWGNKNQRVFRKVIKATWSSYSVPFLTQMLGKPPLNWLHSLNICVNLSLFLCHIHQIKSFQHIVMKTNTFHILLTFYHTCCQDSSPGWLHRPAFPWLNLTSILNLGRLTNLPTPFKHLLPLYYIWIIKSYSMLHKYFRLFCISSNF